MPVVSAAWRPRWRRLKDRAATVLVSTGGAGVLIAILLILFYLIYEVLPLFGAGSMQLQQRYSLDAVLDGSRVAYVALEEQGELGLLIDTRGRAHFLDSASGEPRLQVDLRSPAGLVPQLIVEGRPEQRLLAAAYGDGSVLLFRHQYRLSYPADIRLITPRLEYPYGKAPLALAADGQALLQLAVRDSEEALLLAGQQHNGVVVIERRSRQENFLTGEQSLVTERLHLPGAQPQLAALYLMDNARWLLQLAGDGSYRVWNLAATDSRGFLLLADSGSLFADGSGVSASTLLPGDISLLAGSERGELSQYFMVRNAAGTRLEKIRSFATDGAVLVRLAAEQRRKGFVALDRSGVLHSLHSTANRRLFSQSVTDASVAGASVAALALAPRANQLWLVERDGSAARWVIDNPHPEISWSVLWSKVWYESYPEPDYIWQSSAADNDFEPKYSFSPLAFGTLKAAFYAMLMGAPLAICGAIYTAYFMAPALRRKVKPLIELMEALPTVILGFLAGLWLAPFIEANLSGVFSLLLLLPGGVLLFAFAWSRMPLALRARVPEGWHAVLLMPLLCLLGWLSFGFSQPLELWLFDGDMRNWISTELGIAYDQRNALVVGIAMGLAIIPGIFSISEDAIFSVPGQLSFGSLALGATPWQTLVGVVLPTASPGIFSGLMIGLGRAVGETMIVLMATGNTPIMDANIFEGMRTLAANIAVEVPESEVGSSHYRVLFLAALVLFLFTFGVNTLAEIIRQRLRLKYGSL